MTSRFRNYTDLPGFTKDFLQVRDFLIRINAERMTQYDFLWARWEWAFSLPYLDDSRLSSIGLWEDHGQIVGLATYEDRLGSAYFSLDPKYRGLKREMLEYATRHLAAEEGLKALIPDTDPDFQLTAAQRGFKPTDSREHTAIFQVEVNSLEYDLPKGYHIHSLADGYDIEKYGRVLWRGFNHAGEPPVTEQETQARLKSLIGGPDADLRQKIAVVSADGDYVAYCGTWYKPGTEYALVEPVATDPDHRQKGLGRAAVLEGIKQCALLGAKRAYVGSSQQFYYNIGFHPLPCATWWIWSGK